MVVTELRLAVLVRTTRVGPATTLAPGGKNVCGGPPQVAWPRGVPPGISSLQDHYHQAEKALRQRPSSDCGGSVSAVPWRVGGKGSGLDIAVSPWWCPAQSLLIKHLLGMGFHKDTDTPWSISGDTCMHSRGPVGGLKKGVKLTNSGATVPGFQSQLCCRTFTKCFLLSACVLTCKMGRIVTVTCLKRLEDGSPPHSPWHTRSPQ